MTSFAIRHPQVFDAVRGALKVEHFGDLDRDLALAAR
jgi:hypothetical protein